MSIKEIPVSYVYACDACGATHTQESAAIRPAYWTELILKRDAYDFQGHACADATIKRLLCEKCSTAIVEAVNAYTEKVRKP